MKKLFLLLLILSFVLPVAAQNNPDSTGSAWAFSAWAEMFILPDEQDFFNPTFYARKGSLHLEGRYNYEDLNTASLWVGKRFKYEKTATYILVPMAGGVFGNSNGLAPGLEMEIIYRKIDYYAELEHLFDFNTRDNNFFYMYSELAVRPKKEVRTGLVVQRTRTFASPREIQRGIFGEYYFKKFRAGLFYFSPFASDQFLVASVSVDF